MDDDRQLYESIAAVRAAAAEVAAKQAARFERLERIVGLLALRAVSGTPVTLEDEPILEFFEIPRDHPDPLRRIHEKLAARGLEKPLGLVKCPSCGSKVQDLKGVSAEVCGFCGHRFQTKA